MSKEIDKQLIRWRVARSLGQRNGVEIGQLVGYIDGRICMTLLDKMDPQWSVEQAPIIADGRLIGVQTMLTVDGVTRSDVGVPSNQEPVKGAYSDGLKRAAVHFGIGRELYELPQVFAPLNVEGKSKTPATKPTFNETTGRWEIAAPGWVWYADEEPEPDQDEQIREKRKTIKTFVQQIPGGGVIANEVMRSRGKTKDTVNLDDLDAIINALLEAKAEQDSGAND